LRRKLQNIISKLSPLTLIAAVLVFWQAAVSFQVVPGFMLPSPAQVACAFAEDFPALMQNARTSLLEASWGMLIGVALAFFSAYWMDRFGFLRKSLYPILVITQTVPTVAIAPLLVLWMGYGMAPKIVLVVIVCYFPIAVGLFNGFRGADGDMIRLMRAMGASRGQIFRHVKFPGSLENFFSGLRISVSYSVVGAVIAEWLGGDSGLGVYMTRVRKGYRFDRMFAVIFLVSFLSLLLMKLVDRLEKLCMPWKTAQASEHAEERNQQQKEEINS
jgi:ABC-type nitrate/sulfonate/bicarbonate transport system permease component